MSYFLLHTLHEVGSATVAPWCSAGGAMHTGSCGTGMRATRSHDFSTAISMSCYVISMSSQPCDNIEGYSVILGCKKWQLRKWMNVINISNYLQCKKLMYKKCLSGKWFHTCLSEQAITSETITYFIVQSRREIFTHATRQPTSCYQLPRCDLLSPVLWTMSIHNFLLSLFSILSSYGLNVWFVFCASRPSGQIVLGTMDAKFYINSLLNYSTNRTRLTSQ